MLKTRSVDMYQSLQILFLLILLQEKKKMGKGNW